MEARLWGPWLFIIGIHGLGEGWFGPFIVFLQLGSDVLFKSFMYAGLAVPLYSANQVLYYESWKGGEKASKYIFRINLVTCISET